MTTSSEIALPRSMAERLLNLLYWLGDHGGGEREHRLADGERCPSCDANGYADEIAHRLSATEIAEAGS